MKRIILLTITLLAGYGISNAQDKLVKFGNITEGTVGLQIGKTTQITSYDQGRTETTKTRYAFPAPRLATAFGIHIADKLFLGPGVAYTFQPRDDDNGYAHEVSVFGQTRLHIGRAAIRPFADFKGGYHFASWEQTNAIFDKDWFKWDGFFLEPALGLSFKLSEKTALNGSLGYQYINAGNRIEQSIMTSDGEPLLNAALNEEYHRLLLSLGFTF